ncbi:MAG: class I SAM-dependent methyltransferase [Actinomycetota bacterium]
MELELKKGANAIRRLLLPPIPISISRNFRSIDDSTLERFGAFIKEKYFMDILNGVHGTQCYLNSQEGRRGLEDHIFGRLVNYRKTIIPWLSSIIRLDDLDVLEIGCGTGSLSVALAEQGARVCCLDIDAASIEVAIERFRIYELDAEFIVGNAARRKDVVSKGNGYGLVILSACLEHMTYEERLETIKNAWDLINSNALLGIFDTPNRLWYLDSHTTLLPFFNWLPDEIALQYIKNSPRYSIRNQLFSMVDDANTNLIRCGRGVSYHEIELAIGNYENMSVISYLQQYLKTRSIYHLFHWLTSYGPFYSAFLKKVGPNISNAFFQPTLYLLLEKNA